MMRMMIPREKDISLVATKISSSSRFEVLRFDRKGRKMMEKRDVDKELQ